MTEKQRDYRKIFIYAPLLLLIINGIICCSNSGLRNLIHFGTWRIYAPVFIFLMLLIGSIMARSQGIKSGRRTIWPNGFFWLGWILCFGGIITDDKFSSTHPNYILWTALSLSIIPIMWSLWSSYADGQRELSLKVARAMVIASFVYYFLNCVLTPFVERTAVKPLFEYVGFTTHPNTNGIMCGGFAMSAAFLIVEEKKRRLINAVSFALSMSGVIASNCRSAELGIILSIVCGAAYYLRHKGLPSRKRVGKVVLCMLLMAVLAAASVVFLRYIDHVYIYRDAETSQFVIENTEPAAETESEIGVEKAQLAESEEGVGSVREDESSLYDTINRLSSDRLTIWITYLPLLTKEGHGRIEGPLTKANKASYSAHNNAIEILYASGYAAGAGYIIWMLCCICYIVFTIFAKGPYRSQTLLFILSYWVFFSVSMLDVMQYPFHFSAVMMTYLSLGVVAFRGRATCTTYRIIKRLLDILIATIGCVLLLPLAAFIKIAQLAAGDSGPLFYTQTRTGFKGKEFKIYKFRTMTEEADSMLGELLQDEEYREQWISRQKIDDDPRVTKVGRFLRKTSIDELPQLLNVIKGDMSLIGPRPLVPGELEVHGGLPRLYNKIKPGMTGWWICNGHSGTSYKRRLELEYYYVLNCSPRLDAVCLIKTLLHLTGGKRTKDMSRGWADIYDETVGEKGEPKVSVIIPTLNAEEQLPVILSSLRRQELKPHEIIVVDSASDDDTCKICEEHPDVKLIEIKREDFNHGATRDLALRESSGDIAVFLTQDAIPQGKDFLKCLITPLAMDDVAACSGRQIARLDASEAEKLIREYNYPSDSFLRSQDDLDELGIKTYFVSNVCGAYKRDVYEELGGFETDIKTNEDMFFAAKLISSGYKAAYAAEAEVYHSHDFTWREQYERNRLQGYEISRHKDFLGDISLESEGIKMVSRVALKLIGRFRFLSLFEFILDCTARYLGSRRGRREGN